MLEKCKLPDRSASRKTNIKTTQKMERTLNRRENSFRPSRTQDKTYKPSVTELNLILRHIKGAKLTDGVGS